MSIDHILDTVKLPFYLVSISILHLCYLLIYLKIITYTPQSIVYLNYFIQFFIATFLIAKFHPFRKHELKDMDAAIIFSSAIFLFTNIGFTEFIKTYFEESAKSFVHIEDSNV